MDILTRAPMRGNGTTRWQREAQKLKELSARVHLQSKSGRKQKITEAKCWEGEIRKEKGKDYPRSQVQELEKPVC